MEATSRFAALAGLLGALASPARLEILHALRSPQSASELRVTPALSRGDERPERPLSRQAVAHHLAQLEELGLVRRTEADDPRAEAFVLDPAGVFALVDEIRGLAKLRPLLPLPGAPGETTPRAAGTEPRGPPRPRLAVAYGREDGEAFALGSAASRWRIGRGAPCEVRLEYDPFVSAEHAVLERSGGAFTVRDLQSRNGTWVDWERVPPDKPLPVSPGALLVVGRSVLVIQP